MINQKMTIQAHIYTIKYNVTTNTSLECNRITFDDAQGAQQLYYLGECDTHHMPKEKGMILTQQEMRHLRDALLQVILWQVNQSQRNTLQYNKIIHVETLQRDNRTHTTIEVNLIPDENSQILCYIGECNENQSIGQNGVLLDEAQTSAFCDALYEHLDAKPEEIHNSQEDDTVINETSESEESQETASTAEEASEAVQEPQEDDTVINKTSESEESQETASTVEKTPEEAQGHEEETAEAEKELEQFSQKLVNLIFKNFTNGFPAKQNNFVLGQLIHAYTQEYGEPFPEMSDDEVYRIIKVNAVRYKNQLYVITDTLQSCLSQIIQNGKQMGCQIFYYTRIMDLHMHELNALYIYDKDLLKTYIDILFSNYPNNKNYFKLNRKCNTFNEVFECFTEETPFLTAEQVQEKRPYLEMDTIKSCLGSRWQFVYLITDRLYTTYTRIDIDPEEAKTVKAQVLQDVEEKGFTSLDKYDMPVSESLNRSDIPSFPIREAFYLQYLREDLCRNNHLVSKHPMTTRDIILGYIQSHDVIKHSEIQEYMNENVYEDSWTSAWDLANTYMVRINEDTVVNKELISVDIEKADAAIANYVGDGCRPIMEIHNFALFPYVENYPWNQYFLAGYCKHFSKKYGLSNILDLSYCGLVYAKNGPYNGKDFNTLAAELLAKTDLELTVPNVRTYMKEHGYTENLPNKKRAQQITKKAQFLRP